MKIDRRNYLDISYSWDGVSDHWHQHTTPLSRGRLLSA